MENSESMKTSLRPVRVNAKPKREDIYCYDIDMHKDSSSSSDEEKIAESDSQQEDDDSFTFKRERTKKIIKVEKQKTITEKKKEHSQKKVKKEKPEKIIVEEVYETYTTAPRQQKADVKIFNPVLYHENLRLKEVYEQELLEIQNLYGRKLPKLEEPTATLSKHCFLLQQIQKNADEWTTEREERIKMRKKLSKLAVSTCNRRDSIREQKVKEEERKVRKQATDLMRKVKKEFWGSTVKVQKCLNEQNRRKEEKNNKMKKLEDLVARQFEASKKITSILEQYEEVSLADVTVEQSTHVPVIIDVETAPNYKCVGLHEDNVIRPSILVKFPLREYQLLGVHWIYTLHNRNMNAILADEMGLGKTIQTISLLAHLAIEKGVWGPHLVVVPTTILMNWEIEFKRWCPAFKIMTYFGSPKERKSKRKGWSKLNSFHVCITSYKIAVTDNPIFRRKKWYYMILDEAQNIKNFKSQRWQVLLNFKTKHRLLLTGTPLQNDLTELWSLLHFLMPHVFNSFDDFNEWFNIPFEQALEKNFPISQEILKKLHTVLRPFFLRRLKKDVETQLPKKTEIIIRCSMSRRQKYLYDELIWHENRRNRNQGSSEMMNVLMGLKKICNHPDLFQPRIEESPFVWIPFTVVIAHQMFLKSHFFEYKTHILQDFLAEPASGFQAISNSIIAEYEALNITPDNIAYYRHKFQDRLFYAKVNYYRSLRTPFKPFNFDFKAVMIAAEQLPSNMAMNLDTRIEEMMPIFNKYLFLVPKVMASPSSLTTFPMNSWVQSETNELEYLKEKIKRIIPNSLESLRSRFMLHFPSKHIILYDSGKLVKMMFLLRSIKYRGQKALIFTQMTKMLDIFEKVLNIFKFNYVRLDGNTRTELRQKLVERFNNDPRILFFISSTRSGGIGLNLTGASNVIFYDTDWNPAMDRQAQDRCHRIGQKQNVTIYRLITEHSVEENILMKSIQKRRLEELVTEEGMFDTSYFEKVSLKGLLDGVIDYNTDQQGNLAEVEDEEDRRMLQDAENEINNHKDDDQEEIDTSYLPGLFQYGLRMLNCADDNAIVRGFSDEEDQGAADDQAEVSEEESEQGGEQSRSESEHKPQEEQEKIETVVEEPEIEHDMKLPTLEKLKAISIYQSQYLFMKHQFYSAETEELAPLENVQTAGSVTTTVSKSKSKKAKKC